MQQTNYPQIQPMSYGTQNVAYQGTTQIPTMYQNTNYRMTQPQAGQNYMSGRVVTNEESIIPNEIPMDGSYGVFVQNDLQRIYMKTWGNDGAIHTNRYVLEAEQNADMATAQNDIYAQILQRLDNIEKKLQYRPKPNYKKNNTKKESGKNEQQ